MTHDPTLRSLLAPLMLSTLILTGLPAGADAPKSQATGQTQGKDDVSVEFNPDAPEMKRAFREAQRTLDQFLKATAGHNPHLDNVGVRARITVGRHTEYLWVMPVGTADGQRFQGQLNDIPRYIQNMVLAQEVKFNRADIVDWMYTDTKTKVMHGHYTTCALMKGAPKTELAEVKKRYGLDCRSKLKLLTGR